MIYLDNAATTKIAPEVLEAMMPYLTDSYGNAGTIYEFGRSAAQAVTKARAQVARLFHCELSRVIFTSGGSEGNSMVFSGLKTFLKTCGKTHIIVSKIEHDSVIKAAMALMDDGFDVTFVAPNTDGVIEARFIESKINESTGLVSVMYANNETGAINDVKAISEMCHKRGVLYHCDCVQAAGQYDLNTEELGMDFATISGHKIHAPKGVGAIYIRNPVLAPMIRGGDEQEYGLRGGTENVPGIVALGVASEGVFATFSSDLEGISSIKQHFYLTLMNELSDLSIPTSSVTVNGMPAVGLGKTLSLTIHGVDAESLVLLLDTMSVCVSAGSACRSHESAPSHVLMAMGLTEKEARSTIRVSFSKYNTRDEATEAAVKLAMCIRVLRQQE